MLEVLLVWYHYSDLGYGVFLCNAKVSNEIPVVGDSVVWDPTSPCGSPSCAISTDPEVALLTTVRALTAANPYAGTLTFCEPTTSPTSFRHVSVASIVPAVVLRMSVNDP